MKKSSESNGLAHNLRRAALGTAMVLLGTLASPSWAASLNPADVGQWDCISDGGGQQGIAFIEFYNAADPVTGAYRLRGYEVLGSLPKSAINQTARSSGDTGRGGSTTDTNTPTGGTNYTVVGFTSDGFDGLWGFDAKSNIIGFLSFVVIDAKSGQTNINSVSFNGKVSGKAPNERMSLVASTTFGKVTYKGLRLIGVTNATGYFDGGWYGLKQQNHQSFQEFFSLYQDFGEFNNIYTLHGWGPSYSINGNCMVSRQNRIGFGITEGTNSLQRGSIGTFNKKSVTTKTKGAAPPYGTGNVIQFNAARWATP